MEATLHGHGPARKREEEQVGWKLQTLQGMCDIFCNTNTVEVGILPLKFDHNRKDDFITYLLFCMNVLRHLNVLKT